MPSATGFGRVVESQANCLDIQCALGRLPATLFACPIHRLLRNTAAPSATAVIGFTSRAPQMPSSNPAGTTSRTAIPVPRPERPMAGPPLQARNLKGSPPPAAASSATRGGTQSAAQPAVRLRPTHGLAAWPGASVACVDALDCNRDCACGPRPRRPRGVTPSSQRYPRRHGARGSIPGVRPIAHAFREGALLDDAAKQQIESTGTRGYSLSSGSLPGGVVHEEGQTWAAVQPKLTRIRLTKRFHRRLHRTGPSRPRNALR